MAPRPTARPLRADDITRVAEIERATFSEPWSERVFAETIAADHVAGFAVEDTAGALAGYAVCARVADQGEILNIAVVPHARGRGLGRELLEGMLEWFREHDVADVFLEVRRSNAAAIRLYERAGFVRRGARLGYYRKPPEDAVVMAIRLTPKHAEK